MNLSSKVSRGAVQNTSRLKRLFRSEDALLVHSVAMIAACAAAVMAPGPRVLSVENGGILFSDNPAGVNGMDAGFSVPMGQQTIWLLGDVFLLHPTDPMKPSAGGLSNAALLVPAGRGAAPLRRYRFLTDVSTGLARSVLPYRDGEGPETRLWPMGAWYDPGARKLLAFYARIRTTGGGALDFRLEGYGLASGDAAKPETLVLNRIRGPGGTDVWWTGTGGSPVFGVAVADGSDDGYLYVFGYTDTSGEKHGRVARVPRERVADASAYQYLSECGDPPRWSSDQQASCDVPGLNGFAEVSVAWNRFLGGWLAVHSVGLSERIQLSLAPHPWGPYHSIAEIAAPHRVFGKGFCYAGKEHPELAEEGGRVIYVTYVDSERYYLQLLKVTFDR